MVRVRVRVRVGVRARVRVRETLVRPQRCGYCTPIALSSAGTWSGSGFRVGARAMV